MSKCADSLGHWNTRNVATRVVETVVAGLLILMMAACNVGPNYKRPATSTPQSFRGALAPEVAAPAQGETSILRVAAQRVLEAQAQVGITRAQQLPSVNAGASYSALQIPSALAGNKSDGTPANSFFNGGGFSASAAWNLDFWGLYRRQTEAARAELLASEWGQRATRVTLVHDVAEAYFALRSLDAQLEITKSTIKAREESLQLTQSLERYGAGSLADARQAEELLHAAQANLPELRRQS